MAKVDQMVSALQSLYSKRSALDKQIVAAEKKLAVEAKAAAKPAPAKKAAKKKPAKKAKAKKSAAKKPAKKLAKKPAAKPKPLLNTPK